MNQDNAANTAQKKQSTTKVSKSQLPASCPPDNEELWDLHPKVFLKFNSSNKAKCPYCGANYELAE